MNTYGIRDSIAVLRHYADALERAVTDGDEDAAQRAVATLHQESQSLELATGSQGTAADITRFNGRLKLAAAGDLDPQPGATGDCGERLQRLSRLHEIATDRTVKLRAVIEEALALPVLDDAAMEARMLREILASSRRAVRDE